MSHFCETVALPDINVIEQSFGLGAVDGNRRAGSGQRVAGSAAVRRHEPHRDDTLTTGHH